MSKIFRRKQSKEGDAGSKQTHVSVGAFNLLKLVATNVLFPSLRETANDFLLNGSIVEAGASDLLKVSLREQYAVESAEKHVEALKLYFESQADHRAAMAEDQIDR